MTSGVATISNLKTRQASIQYIPLPMTGDRAVMGFHRHLLEDRIRTESFLAAIETIVKPGDIVADIGAGTGILSFASCRAGAKRVYAIERNAIVHKAREVARSNGFHSQIMFLQQDANTITLPEQVDVMVSECIGLMGMGRLMAAVAHLAKRLLKANGMLIPGKLSMYLAPVESRVHFDYVHVWDKHWYGFDFSRLQQTANNNVYVAWFDPMSFLADAKQVASLDLLCDDVTCVHRELMFTSCRVGYVHGFCGWFEMHLGGGVSLDSSPFSPPTIWRQVFLPLEREVLIQEGTTINVDLYVNAGATKDETDDYFAWNTEVRNPNSNIPEAGFRQSTYSSVNRSP